MSTLAKKRIVYWFLALMTVWPVFHMYLVARYDMSAWKLAGWGMYSVPRFDSLGMEVYFRPRDRSEFIKLVAPTPSVQREAMSFMQSHRWLGRLHEPDRLAALVFAADPSIVEVRVEVFQPKLERDTAMIVMNKSEFRYP